MQHQVQVNMAIPVLNCSDSPYPKIVWVFFVQFLHYQLATPTYNWLMEPSRFQRKLIIILESEMIETLLCHLVIEKASLVKTLPGILNKQYQS